MARVKKMRSPFPESLGFILCTVHTGVCLLGYSMCRLLGQSQFQGQLYCFKIKNPLSSIAVVRSHSKHNTNQKCCCEGSVR